MDQPVSAAATQTVAQPVAIPVEKVVPWALLGALLAVLAYYFWRKKMGCNESGRGWRPGKAFRDHAFNMFNGGSGNAAFDDYRDAVMRRLDEERRKLDEEQMAFRAFVERVRRAKDQEEFDRFMAERNGSAPQGDAGHATP